MELEVGCTLSYYCQETSSIILTVSPQTNTKQRLIKSYFQTIPALNDEVFVENLGNQMIRIVPSPGYVQIDYSGRVSLEGSVAIGGDQIKPVDPSRLPLEVIPFLWPSRYCQSDLLVNMAERLTQGSQPGYASVACICDWIYENVEYRYGTTDEKTSACEIAAQPVGVCRDFAHLGIALCRALGVPARFISGYANKLDPPDFHAYFEAYLDGGWYLFDATRKVPLDGLVRIAVGRDATDVSFANLFGNIEMKEMQVWCHQVESVSQ